MNLTEKAKLAIEPELGTREDPLLGFPNWRAGLDIAYEQLLAINGVKGITECHIPDDEFCMRCGIITKRICDMVRKIGP